MINYKWVEGTNASASYTDRAWSGIWSFLKWTENTSSKTDASALPHIWTSTNPTILPPEKDATTIPDETKDLGYVITSEATGQTIASDFTFGKTVNIIGDLKLGNITGTNPFLNLPTSHSGFVGSPMAANDWWGLFGEGDTNKGSLVIAVGDDINTSSAPGQTIVVRQYGSGSNKTATLMDLDGNQQFHAVTADSLNVTGASKIHALDLQGNSISGATTITATGIISTKGVIRAYGGNSTDNPGIKATNMIEAPSFNATSDIRAKTAIKPVDFSALSLVSSTPIYSFAYKKDPSTRFIGVLAQDLVDTSIDGFSPVSNKTASGKNDDYMTVKEDKLTYILWKAIQELEEQVKELKAQLSSEAK